MGLIGSAMLSGLGKGLGSGLRQTQSAMTSEMLWKRREEMEMKRLRLQGEFAQKRTREARTLTLGDRASERRYEKGRTAEQRTYAEGREAKKRGLKVSDRDTDRTYQEGVVKAQRRHEKGSVSNQIREEQLRAAKRQNKNAPKGREAAAENTKQKRLAAMGKGAQQEIEFVDEALQDFSTSDEEMTRLKKQRKDAMRKFTWVQEELAKGANYVQPPDFGGLDFDPLSINDKFRATSGVLGPQGVISPGRPQPQR